MELEADNSGITGLIEKSKNKLNFLILVFSNNTLTEIKLLRFILPQLL